MGVEDYSTTPATNDGKGIADEGQAPNTVNNGVRQFMSDVRTFYEGLEWRDWGLTVTRIDATNFDISGDYTDVYTVGRRVKCVDTSDFYGVISAVDYNVTKVSYTTVTVVLDSGALTAALTEAHVGLGGETQFIPRGSIYKLQELSGETYFDSEVDNGSSGASKTIDWTAGNKQKITVSLNTTLTFSDPSGPCNLVFKAVMSGAFSIGFVTTGSLYWPEGTQPTESSTTTDLYMFYFDGTDYYGSMLPDMS